jgi:hypothetical protein
MNRVLLVIALAICSVSSTVTATEPYRQWMDRLQGVWEFESSTGRRGEIAFKYLPGNYAMIGIQPDNHTSVQIAGWQPDRGVLVDTQYNADGTYSVIEYAEISEREMRGTFTHFVRPDGNFAGASVVVTRDGDDQATSVISGKSKEGQPLEIKNTFRRKSPEAAAVKEPAANLPAEVLKSMRYLFGAWVADVELAGEKRQVRMFVKPMPGDVGYLIHWTGPGGPGMPDTQLTAIGGWDPTEQVYREMGFATNGDFINFVYKPRSESIFDGKGSGTYMGKKLQERVFVDRKSRDEFTWTASEITVGGEGLPDEVYHFRRVEETQ